MRPRSLSFGRGSLGILKKEIKYVSIYEKINTVIIRRHGDGGMCAEADETASGNGDL